MVIFFWMVLILGQAAQLLLLWRLERERDRDAGTGAEKKPDPMDQGFENLMRFSVRGRTGLEREEE